MSFAEARQVLWDKFKTEYRTVLGSGIFFNTYVEPSSLAYFDDETIVVYCENSIAEKFFAKRYDSVSAVFTEIIGHECTIIFSSDKAEIDNLISGEEKKSAEKGSFSSEISFKKEQPFESNLISKYTFENFVVGDNCRQAYSVATNISENPGTKYNPFFIYANSGLGKTHLLHAIGNEIIRRNPAMRVLYVTTETFTIDYITSIQNNRMEDFRQKYRSVDVLLIDDIQFIANRAGTQEEFFNTFNELYATSKSLFRATVEFQRSTRLPTGLRLALRTASQHPLPRPTTRSGTRSCSRRAMTWTWIFPAKSSTLSLNPSSTTYVK